MQQLTAPVTEIAAKLDTLKDEAVIIRTTFEQLLSLFASCHDIYSKSKPISDAEIDQLSKCKVEFILFTVRNATIIYTTKPLFFAG